MPMRPALCRCRYGSASLTMLLRLMLEMVAESSHVRTIERLAFGPFILSVKERQLLRDGVPVRIGSRALDILISLCRVAGQIVGKNELIRQVWGGLAVDEGALRVHINGLRKALGDGQRGARYIINVPGQGYLIVASVHDQTDDPVNSAAMRSADLPPPLLTMVGREAEIRSLVEQVRRFRFVSLIGPGGIGKTAVATAALHRLRDDFDGDIYFVNLSAVAKPQMVHMTVASTLGVGSGVGDVLPELLTFLGRSRCLLVLDSCEHLVAAVAAFVDAVRREAPSTLLLTTTREPLRVESEHIVRLSSLGCPPEGVMMTATETLTFPAVELFVRRVAASVVGFHLTNEDAPIVANICRKLDGVALALELGAGRVEAYGLAGTADLLERRFGLLWKGRRTAPPRHRTLYATLDWSHSLLEHAERIVFARLSIFESTFTLKAAEAVAADDKINGAAVIDIVASLVAKSIVSPVVGRVPMRYRLLDTTRTYALERLAEHADCDQVALSHAKFLTIDIGGTDAFGLKSAEGFKDSLSDVRAALEWCFTKCDDMSVGVLLATAAASPMLEHALCDECHRWTELAIAHLTPQQKGTAIELELQTSLGWSAMFAAGKGEAVHAAFLRGLAIAESGSSPDPHQQFRLLNGLSFVLSRKCDHVGGLARAEQAADVAQRTSDVSVIALADWALGVSHHLYGNQGLVLGYCQSALTWAATSPYARGISGYGYDYRGRALIARARALWLLGRPDDAASAARFAISEVDDLRHPISIFVVLVYATTVFIWCSEWREAEVAIARLRAHSQTQTLVYRDIAAALEAMLNCQRGGTRGDLHALRRGLRRLVDERHLILVPLCRTTLADALLNAGLVNEARDVIDAALEDLGPQVDGPEVLRIKGAVMGALGDAASGETFLRHAIKLARDQSALAWELRATLSLALTVSDEERITLLAELVCVCSRFPEDHSNKDLDAAKKFIETERMRADANDDTPGTGLA
jgi:predicted ATPase/DNA-binding winged helix-turn-helix (wHTH) protein/tetratricopeptide (TPR) repeat protein